MNTYVNDHVPWGKYQLNTFHRLTIMEGRSRQYYRLGYFFQIIQIWCMKRILIIKAIPWIIVCNASWAKTVSLLQWMCLNMKKYQFFTIFGNQKKCRYGYLETIFRNLWAGNAHVWYKIIFYAWNVNQKTMYRCFKPVKNTLVWKWKWKFR